MGRMTTSHLLAAFAAILWTFSMINFGVNSQEIDNFENVANEVNDTSNLTTIVDNAEMNATEPKSERCEGKVRTYVYDFVEEKFNETSPKIEANIMNATRYLL